jgi:PAS domain S-box-containing protein
MCNLSPQGITTYVNSAAEAITGYRPEELIGQNWWYLLSPESARAQIKTLQQKLAQGAVTNYDMTLRCKTGERRTLRWSFTQNYGSDNQPLEILGFGTVVETETVETDAQELAEHRSLAIIPPRIDSDQYRQAQTEIYQRQQAQAALSQRLRQERLLALVTQRIRQSLDLDEILNTTVAEVRELIQTDRVLIYRFHPDWSGIVAVESVASPWSAVLGTEIHDPCFSRNGYVNRYRQGRVFATEDVYKAGLQQCHLDLLTAFQVRANLVVPVMQDEDLWGLLIAHHCCGPRRWQTWEMDLLQQISNQVGIAIQQAELYRQVQQLNSNLERQVQERTAQLRQALDFEALLKRITDKLRDSLDEDQILQTAVQELGVALEVESCYTGLYDEARTQVSIRHEYVPHHALADGKELTFTPYSTIYHELIQGHGVQVCDLGSDTIYRLQNQFTILACPIADDQDVLGDLWLIRFAHEVFSEEEVRLVQQVADRCAIALRQARLYHKAQTQVKELERLNHLKDDFLSTVSHELRTPMSSIQMATEMLTLKLMQQNLLQYDSDDPDPLDRYLKILQIECQREISLINDLLDLSRLDAGTEPLSLISIPPRLWLSHVAEPFIERVRQQNQTLTLDIQDLPEIETDLSYLERILSELLNNACKYTPPQERITVSAHVEDEMFSLRVSNSGVEIAPAERDRVFDKFYRIPNSDPWKHGGTGLGLALVKKLAEHLGGSIRVESANQLTHFIVTLPLRFSQSQNSEHRSE